MSSATTPPALSAALVSRSTPDVKIPKFIYGTAWKKERSSDLVYEALRAGFRGIDTAAQPRHYREDLVGLGIKRAIDEGIVKREDLFIQTKFTGLSGQDTSNMPYSTSQSLPEQIHTSIASSLKNVTVTTPSEAYIDSLVLHSPLPTLSETHLAWEVLSSYVPHSIRSLGISNTTLPILQSLSDMRIFPSVVQNRFYPATDWEVDLRAFCRERGIVFQSFWTLTGNPGLLRSRPVRSLGEKLGEVGVAGGKELALYALVLGLEGITVLNGTTDFGRMVGDQKGLDVVSALLEGEWRVEWKKWLTEFKDVIGEI